jgi:hypothetical protein
MRPASVPDYAPGTIRGPHRGSKGSPWPWQYAIRTRSKGWQFAHGKTQAEARAIAERLARIIIESSQD